MFFNKFLILPVMSVLAAVGLLATAGSTGAALAEPGHYVVVLKASAGDPHDVAVQMSRHYGLGVGHAYDRALKGFSAVVPAGRLAKLAADERVDFVAVDRPVSLVKKPARPPKPPEEPPEPPPQVLPTGVDRINAEGLDNTGVGVGVAVLDTGIDLDHPDLQANIVGGQVCVRARTYNDDNGHGTHVAGTIAAVDDETGVVGVAPGAELWAVKVLDRKGNGTISTVICGLDYVLSHASANGGSIEVVNMSLSGGGVSDDNCGYSNNDPFHQAICRVRDAGVTVVVAAGNSGANAAAETPAAYDDAVITVSALADSDGVPGGLGAATAYGPDDDFASFSNYGSVVDLAAPGVDIYSTWKGGGYDTVSGTSMAAPHVAGAAVLYLATHPGAAWTEVRDVLRSLGELLGAGHTDALGRHPEPVVQASAL